MLWMFGSQQVSGFLGLDTVKNGTPSPQGPHAMFKQKGRYETLVQSSSGGGRKRGSTQQHQRRRKHFAAVQRPTASVVITVTFVVIFTCIITMEVLFIDEDSRLTMLNKAAAGGGTLELAFDQRQAPVLKEGKDGAAEEGLQFDQAAPLKQVLGGAGRALHQEPDSGGGSGSTWLLGNNSSYTTGDWQSVTGAKAKFFVYSAYLDVRQGRHVRVIGATRTRGHDKVSCVYWYADAAPPVMVPAANRVIRENWNLKYSAVFVLCPLFLHGLGRSLSVPDEVSVVVAGTAAADNNPPVGNRLRVLNREGDGGGRQQPEGFAVCVKPLHYNFDRALQLVEFIELNRILGVRHFTFYNHTVGRAVGCVLRDYVRRGLVTLLPWQLDMQSQKEIRTEGLFAAINDCLYRNMPRYRYLLMIDIDEFIVPHRNGTLASMFHDFDRKINPAKAGSFSFMNSFFYLQWPNDPNSRDLGLPLVTLQKTKRRAKFHPHKQRSKCILVASVVVEMGNHFVWEFLPGRGAVNVPPEIAFLHHYRVCEFGGNDCVKTQAVTDRTVYRYKGDLVSRVQDTIGSSGADAEAREECRGLNLTASFK